MSWGLESWPVESVRLRTSGGTRWRIRGSRGNGRAAAEIEHARPFDAAVPNQCDIRRAASDVDENASLRPRLLAGASSREGVGLRDSGGQLEVELSHDSFDRIDVRHRREGVEDRHLEVLAGESDRV